MNNDKRVVITGLGVVSSIGIGRQDFWDALINGKSGVTLVSSFNTADFPTHYGGEVKNFHPEEFVNKRKLRRLGRASYFAIAASKMALKDAKVDLKNVNSALLGVCIGTTMGESQILEELDQTWVREGVDKIDSALVPSYPCNVLAANVAIELKLRGPNYVIPCACAAGNYAIGKAYDLIRANDADMVLAGGADAFSKIAYIGFNRMFAVAPEKCQPFDKNRKGIIVGEGSGMVVVESLSGALKRNAPIYAEVLGYGLSCDANHMTAPSSDGIKEAIVKALQESGIKASEVDYYNAHGTGTPANDREESLAIKKVFGVNYKKLAVSSIKSMLGHTMGAASAIEVIACTLAIKHGIIPPTINYQTSDPDCDIDCVPNVARRHNVNIAVNSASAFGGNNACLVLKKFAV